MSVNTKYTDKPNDQYQRANLKGLVGYFHKRYEKKNRSCIEKRNQAEVFSSHRI
jgi:hypothetical protein